MIFQHGIYAGLNATAAPNYGHASDYIDRVYAAGGIIQDVNLVVNVFDFLVNNNLLTNLETWVSPLFGYTHWPSDPELIGRSFGITGVNTSGHSPDVLRVGFTKIKAVNGKMNFVFTNDEDGLGGATLTGITGNNDRSIIVLGEISSTKTGTQEICSVGPAGGSANSFSLILTDADDIFSQYIGGGDAVAPRAHGRIIRRGTKVGNELKYYHNNVLVASSTSAPANITDSTFGFNRPSWGKMAGNVEHGIIFNRALTEAEGTLIQNFINTLQ
jgi:hypothetical protein